MRAYRNPIILFRTARVPRAQEARGTGVGGTLVEQRGKRIGRLSAYCADNSTVVNVESETTYFGSSVRYSLDGGNPQTSQWDIGQGGR